MLAQLRRLVPKPVKRLIREFLEKRRVARLFGPLAEMVPRAEDLFDGPNSLEEFKSNGEEFLGIYRTVCDLQPSDHVLDVGSGIGRKTIPLTQYLDATARYEGIDVSLKGVDWCNRKITPRYPNFKFRWVDAHNRLYNPTGSVAANEYRFPFEDRAFTFVTVQSVFTHMLRDDVEHYLFEITRVLTRGRCLISFFLLNDESRTGIATGTSTLPFLPERDGWSSISTKTPEDAVAHDESIVRKLFANAGLKIARVYPGSWCGRTGTLSYQDLVLATKES